MRKHQFVMEDCRCLRRATRFVCKHCGTMEYRSVEELKLLKLHQAKCEHRDAPDIPPKELFKARMGGVVDCLSPDYDTYMREAGSCTNC